MHRLINATLQVFVEDNYGAECWAAICRRAGLAPARFETMLTCDDALTATLLGAMSDELGRPVRTLLEDVGHSLVAHPNRAGIRRLLRFTGRDFRDFLLGLNDLPGRVRLAVPDLDLPRVHVQDLGADRFALTCRAQPEGAGAVLLGLLRAMADDYGALVIIDADASHAGGERIELSIVQEVFAPGRAFDLAGGVIP